MVINISYLLSTPIAAYVFLPVFYRLQSASVYKSVSVQSSVNCMRFLFPGSSLERTIQVDILRTVGMKLLFSSS